MIPGQLAHKMCMLESHIAVRPTTRFQEGSVLAKQVLAMMLPEVEKKAPATKHPVAVQMVLVGRSPVQLEPRQRSLERIVAASWVH